MQDEDFYFLVHYIFETAFEKACIEKKFSYFYAQLLLRLVAEEFINPYHKYLERFIRAFLAHEERMQ